MDSTEAVLNRQKFEREYLYDGIALLTASYQSYVVDLNRNLAAEMRINARIDARIASFMSDNRYRLFPEAIDLYKESVANGYPVRPFESVLNYTATYNANGFLSMYYDRYEFTGGAHGNTLRRSDTYALATGKTIPLSSFFPRGYPYMQEIISEILRQARKNEADHPGNYFENYEELIVKYFNPESYYLTENGIAIYYQQYEIAPYSTGIVVFEIPYDSLGIRGTRPAKNTETEDSNV